MAVLLLLTVLLPLLGALVPSGTAARARWTALSVSLLVLAAAVVLAWAFPGGTARFAALDYRWFGGEHAAKDIRFSLALDGANLWFFVLSALLSVVAVLVSWEAIREQATLFYRMLLILETGMLGVFAAQDVILFYVFFECTLIPLFFLIGIYGSADRRWAAAKFFLYTLAGSVLTFLGLLAIVILSGAQNPDGVLTFSIPQLTAELARLPLSTPAQCWIFLALFAGFAVKVPLVPLHTWLPLAHTEAPTAGSVLLAGILLKIGSYGFLRFCLPMLPAGSAAAAPYVLWLALAGILYGALVALAQTDIKRMIAYSSVSHLGYCMLGLFALNALGTQGGTLQMINHGLSTGGLFAVVGMLYERYHTRKIADLGGLAARMPWLAFFMLVMTLASIGLPGLNGFVGEIMVLLGIFDRAYGTAAGGGQVQYQVIAVAAVLGVVLGAWYMLWLVQRVFFGPLREPHAESDAPGVADLKFREVLALGMLSAVILWIGVAPQFFLDRMAPKIEELTKAAHLIDQQSALTPRAALSSEHDITGRAIAK